jgi:RimJ/RimL family protein N-acetyltransferase
VRTARLQLRPWRDADYSAFAAMCADPIVMQYFVAPMQADDAIRWAQARNAEISANGWGLWAVEVTNQVPFIGFVGIWDNVSLNAVEVGWRLDHPYWHKGYATEAATAALDYGFDEVGLDEIVSCTAALNEPSQRVMQRLGMTRAEADDFEHPRVPEGHPLRPHVLYRMDATRWATLRASRASE